MAKIKKPTLFLDLYKKCMITGHLEYENGLCGEIKRILDGYDGLKVFTYIFDLVIPRKREREELIKEGFCPIYWGSGLPDNSEGEDTLFTPLRQTLILLCAALNGEFD
jgi:hypothetical protein